MFLNGVHITNYKTEEEANKFAIKDNSAILSAYFEKFHRIYQYTYSIFFAKYLKNLSKACCRCQSISSGLFQRIA